MKFTMSKNKITHFKWAPKAGKSLASGDEYVKSWENFVGRMEYLAGWMKAMKTD